MKLYRSDQAGYIYVMRINHLNRIYFGDPLALNVNMANDKRRGCYSPDINIDELKEEYLNCMDKKKLKQFNTPEAMEFYLLYNKHNLKSSIKDYTIRFGVFINITNEVYGGN